MSFRPSIAVHAVLEQDALERLQVVRVDDQQFVFVELHFHRPRRGDDGRAGAAVVEQQVLEIQEGALQHRQVDVFAEQVAVRGAFAGVAGLQHQIDDLAERVEQVQEHVEEFFLRDGRRQHGHRQAGAGVAVDVACGSPPAA